jgi:membrane fusion protein (multidrug efflux system)
MRSRRRRYGLVVVGLLVLVGALAGVKACQITSLIAAGDKMAAAGPPPEAVGSAIVQQSAWEHTLSAVGSVTAVESVAVSNDAPGVVKRIRFESGDVVKRGQILVELDTSTEQAQLSTAKAHLKLAREVAARERKLIVTGASTGEQRDRAESELKTAEGEVGTVEAAIEHKTVRAPFAGKLGIRAVNVGQYLGPGTTVTTLDALDELFVDFSVPQEELGKLTVGLPVRIEAQGTREAVMGKLAAIDPAVDRLTRNVKLRATLGNVKNVLRAGMYVRVSIVLPEREPVVFVPATAIVHAAYGDSLFVVEPKLPGSPGMALTPDGKVVRVARQRFVRLGQARGDFVVVAEGIHAGKEVVSAGAFKLRNGAPIVVDNSTTAKPQLEPRPPNR